MFHWSAPESCILLVNDSRNRWSIRPEYAAASRFVEGGLSDQEVSAISGHKSMQMLKRYTHLRAEDLVGKLDKMNRKA